MRKVGVGLFFLGFSLFVIWQSWQVDIGTTKMPGSGFMSFCTGVVLAFLSLALILQDWKGEGKTAKIPYRVVLALVFLFVYSFTLEILGFYIATFFLVLVLFRLGEARRWWVVTAMSALVILFVYLVFERLLQVFFPPGIFGI